MAEQGAYQRVITAPLPGRLGARPRETGITMVIDKGLGMGGTRDILELAGGYIDLWKFPFGTAAFYPEPLLRAKIAILRSQGIDVYPGGTFLETAIWQNRLGHFLEKSMEIGFTAIEVSDGTIPLTLSERRHAIRMARQMGFRVVTEIGKKDPNKPLPTDLLRHMIAADLDEGSERIIVEGREGGKGVGVYNPEGGIEEAEVEKVVSAIGDPSLLIWEAPQTPQQKWLILRFGANVNLGNIPPQEIIALESLRCGMRADTLEACLPGAARHVAWPGRMEEEDLASLADGR